jgi:hypothetical protein
VEFFSRRPEGEREHDLAHKRGHREAGVLGRLLNLANFAGTHSNAQQRVKALVICHSWASGLGRKAHAVNHNLLGFLLPQKNRESDNVVLRRRNTVAP